MLHNSSLRIVVFDLDGTLLKSNSSFTFCIYLYKKGFFTFSDYFFVVCTYLLHKYWGFSLLWLHAKVFCRLFKNKNVDEFKKQLHLFLDQNLNTLIYDPAIKRLEAERKAGSEIWIFSSSPAFIVEDIAHRFGIENIYATEYLLDHQRNLRGLLNLVDGKSKATRFNELKSSSSAVYSDSILDLPLFEKAKTKIAVKPDRRLRKIAKKLDWEII